MTNRTAVISAFAGLLLLVVATFFIRFNQAPEANEPMPQSDSVRIVPQACPSFNSPFASQRQALLEAIETRAVSIKFAGTNTAEKLLTTTSVTDKLKAYAQTHRLPVAVEVFFYPSHEVVTIMPHVKCFALGTSEDTGSEAADRTNGNGTPPTTGTSQPNTSLPPPAPSDVTIANVPNANSATNQTDTGADQVQPANPNPAADTNVTDAPMTGQSSRITIVPGQTTTATDKAPSTLRNTQDTPTADDPGNDISSTESVGNTTTNTELPASPEPETQTLALPQRSVLVAGIISLFLVGGIILASWRLGL